MVPPQHMMFAEAFTRDSAEGHDFCMSTIDTSRPLATEPFVYFGLSPRCTGRISRGPDTHGSLPSSARLVVYVLSSVFPASSAERAGRTHSADEADMAFDYDQTTPMYLFPMYSFSSTLTGPFHFFSEPPNLLWSLE